MDSFIYDALRTPRGKGKKTGALAHIAPQTLISQLVDAVAQRTTRKTIESVSHLTLGCVGQVNAQGGHIALVSKLASSLPETCSVTSLNNYCVSGLTAIGDAIRRTATGQNDLALAGGVECLSQVSFFEDKASLYNDPKLIKDLHWAPPIAGAELVASLEGFTTADLNEVTLISHERAQKAWSDGNYASSVISVKNQDGSIALDKDEYVNTLPKAEIIQKLPPAFSGDDYKAFDRMMLRANSTLSEISHAHTLANCPGPADGAALALIGNQAYGETQDLKPLAQIVSFAEIAGDPILQFSAGSAAMDQALSRAGLNLSDIDLIEYMEAFAAPPLKFIRDYKPDMEKLNVNGGHLAMGHPMGATGAILVTTLTHEMVRRDVEYGLAVALAGSGIGAAIVLKRA